ncbi:uncharacterized protein LOC127258954 [Andrographis paniculata]|uniref:uncharacterized protein LOC127258954 n=1 Tax=Andrographis paniculata TaxID=175694 RepID=UPI0021E8ADBA|nr:uncharacterized protein LOC127258954 [Andrographis paniculata]
MEGFTAKTYRGIQGYWRKKGYDRLKSGGRKNKAPVVQLGAQDDDSHTRRRFWRIKPKRRLKLKLRFSPKKFLIGLRDAYVNLMLKLANTRALGGGYGLDGASAFGKRPIKEYDEKMLVEIYKSIVMAQGPLVPCEAPAIASKNDCRRFDLQMDLEVQTSCLMRPNP